MVLCSNTNCKMIEIKIFKWDIFYGRHCNRFTVLKNMPEILVRLCTQIEHILSVWLLVKDYSK